MLASIPARLKLAALATAPLWLAACGRDEGTGPQKFEPLALSLLPVMIYLGTELYTRRRRAYARAGR